MSSASWGSQISEAAAETQSATCASFTNWSVLSKRGISAAASPFLCSSSTTTLASLTASILFGRLIAFSLRQMFALSHGTNLEFFE